MAITIQKGNNGECLISDTLSDIEEQVIATNDYVLKKRRADGKVQLVSKTGFNKAFDWTNPATIYNGDTSALFADYAALKTYCRTNFFRNAGGSSGSSIASGLMGYAMTSGTTTGGVGGAIVYVYSFADLKAAGENPAAKIIFVSGNIVGNVGDHVDLESNKTIIGINGASITSIPLRMFTKSNVIVQNITFKNYVADAAVMIKDSSHHVWVDHCDFSTDRNHDWDYWGKDISITKGSDFVTVSWCKFHDTNLSVLISGGIDATNAASDIGFLHVTMHHNYYYNVTEREPDMNYGSVHVFNNYHSGNSDYCISARAAGNVRTDNEYFSGCAKPITTNLGGYPPGYISGESTNFYENCGANDITTATPNWVPSYDYSAYLDPVANVPAIVKANAGIQTSPIQPSYVQNEFLGSVKELGGTIKAIPSGVPFSSFTANKALINSKFEIVPVYFKEACTITGIMTVLQTAGVYTGNNFNGLMLYLQHLGNYTLLGYSAGATNTWAATANTLITLPLNVTVPVQPGVYYVALLYNRSAETTAPKIYCSVDYNQNLWNLITLANSNRLYGSKASVLTPPSPVVASTIVSESTAIPFLAVY